MERVPWIRLCLLVTCAISLCMAETTTAVADTTVTPRTMTDQASSTDTTQGQTDHETTTRQSTETTEQQSTTSSDTTTFDNVTSFQDNNTAANTTLGPRSKVYTDYIEFKIHRWIFEYFTYIADVPGIIGNFFTVLTAARMKPYSATTICIIVLASTDFFTCVMRLAYAHVTILGRESCKSVTFFYSFCYKYSNYILVCWTIERFIAVAFPLKLQSWCTVRNTKLALAGALVFAFLLAFPNLTEVDVQFLVVNGVTVGSRCTYSEFIVDIYSYIDATFFIWLPMAVILICNVRIISIMSKRHKAHANMTNNQESQDKRSLEQRRMTRVLLSVCIAFLLFHTPYLIKTGFDIYFFKDPFQFGQHFFAKYYVMSTVAISILKLQNVVNFVVYCLSGPRFRQEFMKIVCFFRSTQPSKTAAMETSMTGVSVITSKTA